MDDFTMFSIILSVVTLVSIGAGLIGALIGIYAPTSEREL